MDSDAVSDVYDTTLTMKHSSDDAINNDDFIFNNDDEDNNDNKYKRIIPWLKTRYATPLKDSSLQKATRIILKNHQVPTFTSKLDEHGTQGWEQVERPKRHKSDKTSKSAKTNTPTTTKLAETEIIEQAKEASFKKLLEEIKNDKLMETGNTDINMDDNDDINAEADDAQADEDTMDTEDTNNEVDCDKTAVDEIEEFVDNIPRATH